MLPRRTLEMIVDDCMIKFAMENSGSKGWTKADINEAVFAHGGEKSDVYAAMKIGMDICFGEMEMPEHYMS